MGRSSSGAAAPAIALFTAACATAGPLTFTRADLADSPHATLYDFLRAETPVWFAGDTWEGPRIGGLPGPTALYVDGESHRLYRVIGLRMSAVPVRAEFLPDASVLSLIPLDSVESIRIDLASPGLRRFGVPSEHGRGGAIFIETRRGEPPAPDRE